MDGQEAKSGREFAVSLLDSQMVQMVQMTVQAVLHRKKTTSARFPLNVLLFWITGMI